MFHHCKTEWTRRESTAGCCCRSAIKEDEGARSGVNRGTETSSGAGPNCAFQLVSSARRYSNSRSENAWEGLTERVRESHSRVPQPSVNTVPVRRCPRSPTGHHNFLGQRRWASTMEFREDCVETRQNYKASYALHSAMVACGYAVTRIIQLSCTEYD